MSIVRRGKQFKDKRKRTSKKKNILKTEHSTIRENVALKRKLEIEIRLRKETAMVLSRNTRTLS